MKRITFSILFLIFAHLAFSNFLVDILNGKFQTKGIASPRSMVDGEYYTLKTNNAIVRYKYATGETMDTIFSIHQVKDCPIKHFSGYSFSPNELKILVYNNVNYRYRRTFTADYYVYDVKRKELQPLSEHGNEIEVPIFSPNSRYIAFARKNNLYMKKLDFNTEIAITKDGEFGKIINGTPDWVYEEEFEATRYFEWSPDSKLLAFVKFDESKTSEFSFQTFKGNDHENLLLYPNSMKFKYPKAGELNSTVSVCVYDDFNKTTRFVQLPDSDADFYIPRLRWTNDVDQLAVFKLNRNQNQLDMFFANPKSTQSKLILRQTDKYYVDYGNIDYMQFSSDNKYFFAVTENDRYKHIYKYNMNGQLNQQITKGKWDVTNFYGYDEKSQTVYYQSAELSPTQRDIYAIDAKGRKTRLSDQNGINTANFNSDFSYYVHNYSSISQPNSIKLRTAKAKIVRELINNNELKKEFTALNMPEKEMFSFETSEKVSLNGWMLKPVQFDASKKYPVLQVQYSGPGSQQVLDSWGIGWEYYLASKGYIVVCVDGRGTGARGSEFQKCTYQQLGILETKDQVETAKYLGKQSFVDKDRLGIWGWSYGGSMTLWAMSTGEKIFKAGIAVAPVTDWRLYNTAYTERFMRTPQENFEGYNKTSAIGMADKLEGKLLIVHGSADDNVHVQNTMLYVEKLVEADKQFEMQIYTDKDHSILGRQTRKHLYTRMTEFLFNNL